MKLFVSLLALGLSVGALANAGDSRTFTYDGSQNSAEVVLRTVKTHTEYEYRQIPTTCYRQEVVGHRTHCEGPVNGPIIVRPGPGRRPHPGPRPMPRPGMCRTVPIYRSVPYTCMMTEKIPYEVKDYDVEARLILDITKLEGELAPNETFSISLYGDSLSVLTNSNRFLAVVKKKDLQSTMRGSLKQIDALYAIELIEAAPVQKALNISDASITDGKLIFTAGTANLSHVAVAIEVQKKKFLRSDETLINRELTASEIEVVASGNSSEVAIDLSKLGISLDGGKFEVKTKLFFKSSGMLLNSAAFEKLEATNTIIYTNR